MGQEYKSKRKEFMKGFKKGPDNNYNEEPSLDEELSEEEQAQQDQLDEEAKMPLKQKITRSIINLLKKKGPPPAGR